jgi:hypothetical protein
MPRNSTNDTDMKIYILQQNYSYTDYEAGWDENGVYEEEFYRRDVIGVFTSLEDAVRKLVDVCKIEEEYVIFGKSLYDYDILVGDTETTQVKDVSPKEYERIAKEVQQVK